MSRSTRTLTKTLVTRNKKNPNPGKSDKSLKRITDASWDKNNKSSKTKVQNAQTQVRRKISDVTDSDPNKANLKCTKVARETPSGLVGPKCRLVFQQKCPPTPRS